MKKSVMLILAAIMAAAAFTSCGGNQAVTLTAQGAESKESDKAFSNVQKIPYKDGVELGGAAGVERQADVLSSPYYSQLDYFSMKSSETLTILTGFPTIQQTTEWTCGPACVQMVMDYYEKLDGKSDLDLAALRQNDEPGATTLKQMLNIFNALGGWEVVSTFDLEDPTNIEEDSLLAYLKDGKPVIIGTDDWGGHWQVVVGYDTMGTETTADDVLILADPYDTTDHNQDGYVVFPFERLYYNFSNRFDPDFDRNVFLVASPKE